MVIFSDNKWYILKIKKISKRDSMYEYVLILSLYDTLENKYGHFC